MISLRSVINVAPAVDVIKRIKLAVNGHEGILIKIFFNCLFLELNNVFLSAHSCIFPFIYKSVSYSSCTTVDLGFSWCSPSRIYNGKSIPCSPLGKFNYIVLIFFLQ